MRKLRQQSLNLLHLALVLFCSIAEGISSSAAAAYKKNENSPVVIIDCAKVRSLSSIIPAKVYPLSRVGDRLHP
jgi:hypothetical protein